MIIILILLTYGFYGFQDPTLLEFKVIIASWHWSQRPEWLLLQQLQAVKESFYQGIHSINFLSVLNDCAMNLNKRESFSSSWWWCISQLSWLFFAVWQHAHDTASANCGCYCFVVGAANL